MNKLKSFVVAASAVLLFTTSANACLAACKEKKRDEAYSKQLSAATLQTIIDNALPQKVVDPELGEPYQVYPIDVKPYDKDFHATLIEYPYGSSPRALTHEPNPRGIILYVHGYNDYFFQGYRHPCWQKTRWQPCHLENRYGSRTKSGHPVFHRQ